MSYESILQSWQKKNFKPIYWLEGEEEYYLDQLMDFAEHALTSGDDAAFNLSIFYGRDADWATVTNACRRYPMFAERQFVLLKEAQFMRDLDKLEPYFENPLPSTILIIAYKGKKFDRRTKFFKTITKQAEVFTSDKIRDEQVRAWIEKMVKNKGLHISPAAAQLLDEHIGNDLTRISNEVEKLTINLQDGNEITEDDIEKYVGISKEFNAFELSAAIANRNLPRALTILQYFEKNPKAAPIQMALPGIYSQLSRVYVALSFPDQSEQGLKAHFFYNPSAVKTAMAYIRNYGYAGIDKCLLLLHQYNMRSLGVGDSGTDGAALMKEMVGKMISA